MFSYLSKNININFIHLISAAYSVQELWKSTFLSRSAEKKDSYFHTLAQLAGIMKRVLKRSLKVRD